MLLLISQQIYSEIPRLREYSHKTVVAYMSTVGASGAYYAACGALIDAAGDFQDAVDLAAKLAGISGKPMLVRNTRQRTTLMDLLTGDISHLVPFSGQSLKSQIRFQYLWK